MSSLIASSEDIVKLTQQMCLVIAKDKPDLTLKYTIVSMKKIIDKIFSQNLSYARTKKVKLVNKCENDLPELKLNETKIEEVIDNLLNNAIKFAPPETIVEIKSSLKDNSLIVEVGDNGVGLSKDDLARVFQKGATLSSQPTGLEHSSGLGLWIAKKMVEEHKGKIWVSSKVGEGSTFSFSLPLDL
jgi:signal transduction histidine kinase